MRTTGRRWVLHIALTAVLLCACSSGSDGDDPSTGDPDAMTGAGGSTAPTVSGTGGAGGRVAGAGAGGSTPVGGAGVSGAGGSSGAASVTGVSATEACIEYYVAGAVRVAECSGNTPGSLEVLQLTSELYCPDLLFASGSTRTPEGTIACAEIWRTFPCEALAAGEIPDCTTPGTRAMGETCIHDTQCEQLRCSAPTTGECGVCSARDEGGFELPAQVGDACGGSTRCVPDAYCDGSNPNGGGFCMPLVTGTPCADRDHICGTELYCASEDETCRAFPGAGEGCGRTTDSTRKCAPGTECVSDTCQPFVGVAPGGRCDEEMPCGLGTHCRCLDDACADRRCVLFGLPGDPCTDPNVVCHAGTECLAGVCEPRDPAPFQCN